jgi:hypothetical protein
MKKGAKIKSYLTWLARNTATSGSTIKPATANLYLEAILGINHSSTLLVTGILVNIASIRVNIQRVVTRCVLNGRERCVFKIIKVARFKIQYFTKDLQYIQCFGRNTVSLPYQWAVSYPITFDSPVLVWYNDPYQWANVSYPLVTYRIPL